MTPPRSEPPLAPTPPARRAPPGVCDAHVHLLGSPGEAGLLPERIEDPAEAWGFDDYLDALRAQSDALGVERTVIVQSILHGTDNALVARGIGALGPDRARGVGLVPDGTTGATLSGLAGVGIVGVRLNYVHGGVLTWEGAEAMAPDLADQGMHVEMLLRAEDHAEALAPRIAAMPVPVVLGHMGWPDVAAGVGAPGFHALLRLLEGGGLWVKLSGIYRLAEAPFEALEPFVTALLEANPARVVWGSDFPQIMLGGAARAPSGALLDALDRACPDAATRRAVLVDNPAALYGF